MAALRGAMKCPLRALVVSAVSRLQRSAYRAAQCLGCSSVHAEQRSAWRTAQCMENSVVLGAKCATNFLRPCLACGCDPPFEKGG